VDRAKEDPDDRSIKTGSDFLQLNAGDAPAGGLSGWLAAQLRLAVADGRLPVSSRLPATRVLAAELGVSRGVVTEAYQRLTEDGHVAGRGRSGTIVVAAPVVAPVSAQPSAPGRPPTGPSSAGSPPTGLSSAGSTPTGPSGAGSPPTSPSGTGSPPTGPSGPGRGPSAAALAGDALAGDALAGDALAGDALAGDALAGDALSGDALFAAAPGVAVFDSLRAVPARIDLTPGVPDLAAFPRAAWLRAERSVLGELSPADFGYGDPRGTPALRQAVATWLGRTRGIRVDPGGVIIVAGVAQALGLLGRALRADGITAVAVEDPGSLGTRQQLQNERLDTPPVPVDSGGLRTDELRASGAPAVLLTPAHQFPAGVVLDGERRRELMRWAGDGGLIIEDDYDAEHRYDRPPVPALHSMLAEHVCYAASVSKLLAPALRVGWLLAPPKYRDTLVAAKRHADLGNAVLPQLVLARLMDSGELDRQLRFMRGRHRRRRDAMITAIRSHLPGAVVHGAAAGLHLMITFEGGFADADLAAAALARGVKVQPLSWHSQGPCQPGLVLGYAANSPTDIGEGIAIIGEVLGGRQ
jgi:GntR family transcriptional regulator/MocR family aminotransferase